MLKLTRRRGEVIVVGQGKGAITITVLETDRHQVRLGIDAPKDVPISHREKKPPTLDEFAEGILED